MQTKTTVRYHFTVTRMIVIKKTVTSVEDLKKLEPSYISTGNVKWYIHFGKQLEEDFNSLI